MAVSRSTQSAPGCRGFMSLSCLIFEVYDYTYLGSLGGASCHWWPLGDSGCGRLGYRALFIGCGGGRTFAWCGLTIGGKGGWAGFAWVWFSWTRVRLVLMELKYHNTNKKKTKNQPKRTQRKRKEGKRTTDREKKGQSLIAVAAAAAVKWQYSQQPYGIIKLIENEISSLSPL